MSKEGRRRATFVSLALLALCALILLIDSRFRSEPSVPSAPPSAPKTAEKPTTRDSGPSPDAHVANPAPDATDPAAVTRTPQRNGTGLARTDSDDRGPVHRHLIRSRETVLDPSLREIAAAHREAGLEQFSLPGFDGEAITVRIRRVREHALGGTVLSGTVAGAPSSRVILAEKEGAASGAVRLPGERRIYEIRPLPDGGISLGEVDVHALGQCGVAGHHTASRRKNH